MKQKKKVTIVVTYSILLFIVAELNNKLGIIKIPELKDMASRQIDYITISTVFAGFSFTALGLLLGLSSEKLIEKIKNTNIIMHKVRRIICSIVFLILSVVVSMLFVLGLDVTFTNESKIFTNIYNVLYIFSIGYLIIGIGYFVYAVYELYDLIRHVYSYNKELTDKKINKAKEEMEATREKMRRKNEE